MIILTVSIHLLVLVGLLVWVCGGCEAIIVDIYAKEFALAIRVDHQLDCGHLLA
jgi:hypothetical protein